MKKKITLWAVALLASVSAFAQVNVNMPYNTGVQQTFSIAPPNTCSFNFFDNGGAAGAYSNSSNPNTSIVTFAPSNATNKIRATFVSFSTESGWDPLYIFNGATIADTRFSSGNGVPAGAPNLTPDATGGWWGTQIAAGTAFTSTNANGNLTFAFDSDGSVNSTGWEATIAEVPPVACVMTVGATVNATSCQNIAVPAPTFAPAGCNSSLSLRYRINGGSPVVIGSTVPASITIASLPLGTVVLTWELVNPCGGVIAASGTQTVNVSDVTPPVLTCPGNVTLNLDAGECSIAYNFNVTATDDCPYFVAGPTNTYPTTILGHGAGAITWAGNNAPGGFYFNLTNTTAQPMRVKDFWVRFGSAAFGAVGSSNVVAYTTTSATTYVGNQANAAAWTQIGNVTVTPAGTNSEFTKLGLNAAVDLAPGASKGFYLLGTQNSLVYNSAGNSNFTPINVNGLALTPGQASSGLFVAQTTPRTPNVQVEVAVPGAIPVVQTSGLASGELFPIGTTNNCFSATDASGLVSNCCFTVTVREYPNPITSLVCNDLVYVSLDENCSAVIGADQVLEGGPYGCYDDYVVELDKTAPFGNGPWVPAVLGAGDIGKTYQVRVTDPTTGNKCWGNLKVEDKLPPVLDCPAAVLPCNFNTDPTYSAAADLTLRFGATGLPVSLPDLTTRTFTIPVGIAMTVNDVDFRVKVSGDVWFGNISMRVKSPAGTTVTAWQGVGGCSGPIWCRFDDEGSTALTCANFTTDQNAAIPFNFGLLSAFDGQQAQGDWVIEISDVDGFGDQSSIEIAELYINGTGVFTAGFPNGLTYPGQVFPNGANSFTVPAGLMDACTDVTLTYIDTETQKDCASGLTKTINRKWTARDASGNTSTCIQAINLLRPTLADVTLPVDYDDIDAPAFHCTDNAYPTPDWIEGQGLQGYPYVYGAPVGCSINWEYADQVLEVCDGTYKIRRDWTIIDWCIGDGFEYTQLIKVLDNAGPSIACPANITVSTDPFNCCASVDLPDVIIEDNCSQINNISGMVITFDAQTGEQIGMTPIGGSLTTFPGNNLWDLDTLGRFGYTSCLPLGTHTVIYQAEDDCGNTSTCSFRVIVRDYVPPVAACTEVTTVAIGVDDPFDCYEPAGACEFAGVTWVKASVFDQGSTDNCGSVKFTIRRMAPYSDCINNLNQVNGHPDCSDIFPDPVTEFDRAVNEQDSIKFYCCEVGTTQTIVLRVYQINPDGSVGIGPDGTPVFNECMIQVQVQDKIKPVCVSPANVTVSCENFDPSLWAYGKASIYDNCCLDTTKVYQGQCGLTHSANYNQFDTVCNKGTIIRTFRAFDCHGLSSQCTQRVVVNYEQDYFVKFPNDRIVTVCDGTGNYGEPEFFGEDCELLASSYTDELFTVVPDACYKLERTWKVINWCTYNPNLGCVNVPNPNPNAITNHPSNLPGPIVSAAGTIAPWNPTIVKINPTDATATNYSVFYDANANCYVYKQIIKVIDTKAPTAQCPASPVEFCDVTPNNPQLWNEMYWWDNVISSHDLCEGPADLTITATDACSGANINIEYLLFLDLDGNGSMETVISSTNLPAWNTVFYNNASNPNFTGGTARSFDERPVLPNQKYGFAIQETTSGTNKTASVRWNTQQNQTSYTVPELPYGTHKIKWIISDGCGNESVCEYTFVVKDCKKPTVVCLNGLSVNIMPTQMIALWASDFLQYTEDNCTPAPQIKIGIVKSSESTGTFPVDGNGNPITGVTFTCAELGTQPVQLWAIDAAGNADYCETYVIVQDNAGNCGQQPKVSVAGALATEGSNGLEDATVDLQGSHPAVPPIAMFDYTGQAGNYEFSNAIPVASNVTVTPVEDDNHINGVSTFDLVLISKHILGLEPLTSPYKMIAADANKSGSITTFDIVELRKLVLGVYTELPNNNSWRFVDKSFSFPNPANPFQTAFPENKSIANIQASQSADDFVAVKIGDLNGNAVANSLMATEDRTAGTLLFDVQDRAVKAGEVFDVTFKATEKVQGYQFTMNFAGLEVMDVVPGAKMTTDNFAVFAAEKALTTSFDADAQGEFTVRFRATQGGELSKLLNVSSRITKAEAYTAGNDRLDVAFRFNGANGAVVSGVGFELYQNQPNPFVSKTTIGFHLPEAASATLTIFDETGRVLFTQQGDFAKGYNQVAIDRALLSTTGMMYYKLETATESATKKMIQTK